MKRYLQKIGLLLGLLMVTVTGWGQYGTGFPYVNGISTTSATLNVKYTKIGFVTVFICLPSDQPTPTIENVLSLSDPESTPLQAGFYGEVGIVSARAIYPLPLTNLKSGSDYKIYTVTTDGNYTVEGSYEYTLTPAVPTEISFRTLTPIGVSSLNPVSGTVNLPVNSNFTVTFSETISRTTGTSVIKLYKKDAGLVETFVSESASISLSSDNLSIIINPSSDLNYSSNYYFTMDAGYVKSATNGIPCESISSSEWFFSTVAPPPSLSTPPLIPADNSIDITLNTNLSIAFSTNVRFNSTSTNHSIKIYQSGVADAIETINCVSGTATYSTGTAIIDGAILTINPTTNLLAGTSYYVMIDDGALESTLGGVYPGFTDATTWNFSTFIPVAYITGYPKVQNIGSTSVDVYSSLNKAGTTVCVVVPATDATPSITQVMNGEDAAGNTVPAAHFGSFSIPSAGVVRSDVLSSLSENTSYKVCFVSIDGSGNYLETVSPTVVTFSTIDTSGPTLTFDPVDGNESVPIEQIVKITFNEAVRNIDDSEITSDNVSNLIMFRVGGVEVPRTVTFDNVTRTITINTTSLLEAGMTYYLTVKSVEDFNGNATGSKTIYFITKDTTAPYIKTSIPANGAKNVSLYEPVVITFNEPILNFDGSEVTSASISTILSISPAVSYSASISADKSIVTLTPNEYAMTTLYTVTLNGNTIKDKSGNVTTASSSFSFTTETCNVWNGSTNSDYSDGSNYASGSFTSGKSIIVNPNGNLMLLYDDMSFPSLIIKAGAQVNIGTDAAIELTKDLRVLSSNDVSVGNGSILIEGSLDVASTNVYFYQNVSTTDYTYHLSSPVVGATKETIGCTKIYQKTTDPYKWLALGSTDALVPGKGYAAYDLGANVWQFCGAVNNNSSYTFNAVRTSVNYGWNLAGNPYPCSINWDNVILTNVKPTFYMWHNDQHAYGTYNRTDGGVAVNMGAPKACMIPSMHAFFIQVEDDLTDGSITIPNTVRALNEYTYMKSADVSTSSIVRLTGHVGTSVYKDEMVIRFAAGALKDEISDDYDSPKQLNGASDILDLYVVENSIKYAISSSGLEYINDSEIQLGFNHNSKATEICTIELASLENVGDDIMIYLEDTSKPELGMIDFRANPTYSFQVTGVESNTIRFKLHFVGDADSKETVTSIEESDKSGSCVVYSIDNTVFVKVTDIDQATCQIMDVNGKVLMLEQINTSGLNRYTVEKSGVYLVKIVSENNVWNQKVLINK